MSTAVSSRSTLATLGSTVALTAAVALAYQWQKHQNAFLPFATEQKEQETTPRVIELIKPSTKPEQDAVSETEDTETDSTSESEEENTNDTSMETIQDKADEEVLDESKQSMKQVLLDITRRARPEPEQVMEAGWDADEVPMHVRVVDGLIQYTGPLGQGARCVRAMDALPKPKEFKTVIQKKIPAKGKGPLRKKNVTTITKLVAEPFVQTYKLTDASENTTERMVSYFEVNITQGPQDELVEESWQSDIYPCIAVGISLHDFQWERNMPGWNAVSYGYHGDDGSAFFACRKQEFGPVFGMGDTVGCGIDYEKRRVFYTLNGEFLGYSFELNNAQLQRHWIPTVGLDSHAAVQYNEQGPFKFDLNNVGKMEL